MCTNVHGTYHNRSRPSIRSIRWLAKQPLTHRLVHYYLKTRELWGCLNSYQYKLRSHIPLEFLDAYMFMEPCTNPQTSLHLSIHLEW